MINKVILIGNVGNDPEVRQAVEDKVANFTLATSESYKNKQGEKVTNVEWHRIIAWRGLASIVENYIKKGSQLYIEGKIQTRSWDDKDGNKRYVTEINASTIKMLGRKESEVKESEPEYDNNDLPF